MPLTQTGPESALWVDPGRGPGPGTFAVVIGVSRYENLKGAPTAAPNSEEPGRAEGYGLGQLDVSSLTAFRFFDWLRSRYDHPAAPLVRCWLLLAPTEAERAEAPQMPAAPLPTFEACKRAIEAWYASLEALSPVHAEGSRALFFFSGHGLEMSRDNQVLLPHDYLRPPVFPLNEAISTLNLAAGLRGLAVNEQILLVDACRNGPLQLRGRALQGASILNEAATWEENDAAATRLVYAAASGQQAWQPRDPRDGPSVFGQALLDGLQARAGMEPDCDPPPCRVAVEKLSVFLKRRVAELHAERASRAAQRVELRMEGNPEEVVLTRVKKRISGGFEAAPKAVPPVADPIVAPAGQVGVQVVANGVAEDFGPLHDLFESEALSEMWDHAMLHPLDAPAGAPARLTVLRVGRDLERLSFRAQVRVEEPGAFWLRLHLPGTPEAFGCVLPGDHHSQPVYEVEISRPARGSAVDRLEVGLSEESADPRHKAAARLWRRYRAARRPSDVDAADLRLLRGAVEEKLDSPLAATVAALVLLRTREEQLPTDWLRNLAAVDRVLVPEFARYPDGPVLLATQLLRELGRSASAAPGRSSGASRRRGLREAGGAVADEILRALLSLEKRGLPRTIEGLSLASRQIGELLAHGLDPNHADEAPFHARLTRLQERLVGALVLARFGGLFPVFAGPLKAIQPALVAPVA